jgi:hypothetical protein
MTHIGAEAAEGESSSRWRELGDSAWLWGAIGLIAGAAASVAPTQSLRWIFIVAWVALSMACIRHLPPKKLPWRICVNFVTIMLIAGALYFLDRRIIHSLPKPKDPSTATENAAAVVALEKEQGLIHGPGNGQSPPMTTLSHRGDTVQRRPQSRSKPPESSALSPATAPATAALTVTQSPDVSTDADAPYKTIVVVQTTREFPSLRLALECDGPIAHASGGTNGMIMMSSQGVVDGHPNVFVFTYGSAMPGFTPSNPLQVSVWSKQTIHCGKAITF